MDPSLEKQPGIDKKLKDKTLAIVAIVAAISLSVITEMIPTKTSSHDGPVDPAPVAAPLTEAAVSESDKTPIRPESNTNHFPLVTSMSLDELQVTADRYAKDFQDALAQINNWYAKQEELKPRLKEYQGGWYDAKARAETMFIAAKIMDIQAEIVALASINQSRSRDIALIIEEITKRGKQPIVKMEGSISSAESDKVFMDAKESYEGMREAFTGMQSSDAEARAILQSGYNRLDFGSDTERFSAEQILIQSRASERALTEAIDRLPPEATLTRQQMEFERRIHHEIAEYAAQKLTVH